MVRKTQHAGNCKSVVALSNYKRIAIKVGSALLVDRKSGVRDIWLKSLCADIAKLQEAGCEIMIISSGAIALGRTVLDLPSGILKLEESQAAAAVGQIALAPAWNSALKHHNINTGQILLTLEDTETRRRYLNARATLSELLRLKAIPVINENDTVATSEIRYGDNDRLAARVATMMNADLLILLSDIDGLYTAPPALNPDAVHLPIIDTITPEIEAMAGSAASELSRGGMRTKIDAGKIATHAGTAMIIAKGEAQNPLQSLQDGARFTLFKPSTTPVSAWKNWIAGQLEPQGKLIIDEGARGALLSGKSLLAAGVKSAEGDFQRGDTVAILLEGSNIEVARGLSSYSSHEAQLITGRRSSDIETILGYAPRAAMVHRDDMVIS
ncbi:glutamate 5-kinase [Ahrensia sp. 13_GOM-1096m]|uniref:glutamate 5-kinase n=1 Tax=Ahrensia sp. 13_GOM-1096m TaxID=1380380 RepID=UPI00068654FD|nr:glutamate 5-kinase [Ahrensia sp. 13_GOM-1096m]